MEKKRGVLLVLAALLILSAASALAAGDSTSQDITVGVIVVAILIIIIVVLLILILKKKAKKETQKAALLEHPADTFTAQEIAPVRAETVVTVEPQKPAEQPKPSGSGGFLAKARSLQQGSQTSPGGQKEDPYNVGGFKKEEVEKILAVPESNTGPMKTCKGCGFELSADEKVCPVCGKKQ